MTYKELLNELHNSEPQPNPIYWETLLNNSKPILLEISLRNQHLVSKELGMNRMQLSHIMPILREFALKD